MQTVRPSLFQRLRQARFFTISLLFHLIVVALLGGVVLFKAVHDNGTFVAVGTPGSFLEDNSGGEESPGGNDQMEFEQPTAPAQPQETEQAPLAMSAIQSLSESSTSFEISAVSDIQTAGIASGSSRLGTISSGLSNTPGAAAGPAAGRGGLGGGKISFFGSTEKTAGGIAGYFYDLKQTRHRKPSDIDRDKYVEVIRTFLKRNWSPGVLDDYYRSPQPLYLTHLMIPIISADLGPQAFHVEKEVQPSRWVAHYKGKLRAPENGKFRFAGLGDDILLIKFNGRLVLDGSGTVFDQDARTGAYVYEFPKATLYYVQRGNITGEWFNVQGGKVYEIEVLIGERPGGQFFEYLTIEKSGETYPKDRKGNPILPVFRMGEVELQADLDKTAAPPFGPMSPVWTPVDR